MNKSYFTKAKIIAFLAYLATLVAYFAVII